MEDYIEFKKFPYKHLINQIAEIFDANGVDYIIENTKPSVDITFTNSGMIEYLLKVKTSDFNKATELLSVSFPENMKADEHYMDAFTDDELIEVISSPEDWDNFDLDYAKRLISIRGIEVNDEKKRVAKQKIVDELIKPVKAETVFLLLGYLLTILTSGIGFLIALRIKYRRNNIQANEDGEESINYYYDSSSRKHADIMIGLFVIWILLFLYIFYT